MIGPYSIGLDSGLHSIPILGIESERRWAHMPLFPTPAKTVLSVLNSDPSFRVKKSVWQEKPPTSRPKIQQTFLHSQHSRWDQTSPQRPQVLTLCLDPLPFPVIFSSFDAVEAHFPNACHPTNRHPFLLSYFGGSTPSVPVSVLYSHSHQRHFSAAPTRLASQSN